MAASFGGSHAVGRVLGCGIQGADARGRKCGVCPDRVRRMRLRKYITLHILRVVSSCVQLSSVGAFVVPRMLYGAIDGDRGQNTGDLRQCRARAQRQRQAAAQVYELLHYARAALNERCEAM